jgi:hypothetical protein
MNLTAEQIQENYKKLIKVIEDNFINERRDNLLKMYEFFEDRMLMAPASGLVHYHNAFPGGYVDHVLRVVEGALNLYNLWESMESTFNYSKEELVFSALNHDLGKIGDLDNDYYVPETNEWQIKNRGIVYMPNKHITNMSIPDRSLWLLQHFNIKYSQNEMIAIMIHDGMYDEANAKYFKTWGPEKTLKVNLPILLHHADHMASRIEYEKWKSSTTSSISSNGKRNRPSTVKLKSSNKNINASKLFDDLFKE